MAGDRSEQATPHRREKARREGDVLYSRELTSAAGTLAGILTLGILGSRILDGFQRCLGACLDFGGADHWDGASVNGTLFALRGVVFKAVWPLGVVAGSICAAATAAGMLQTGGFEIHPGSVGIRLSRLSPVTNFKNLFSLRAASRLGRSLIPASFLAVFSIQRIARELQLPPFSITRIERLGSDVAGLVISTGWLVAAWALVDYVVEWRSRESRLRMSREEMKQEFKESEGSPQTRGRIRGLQRQMRRRKVKADVSRAAVVLTNPTHYAVALTFNFVSMEPPKVLAKGRNLLAEEIKAEARWAGVPIVENPPLARSLYRSVEVGRPIPVDLYAAVAAILAYLYRQRVDAEIRERRANAAKTNMKPAAPPVLKTRRESLVRSQGERG